MTTKQGHKRWVRLFRLFLFAGLASFVAYLFARKHGETTAPPPSSTADPGEKDALSSPNTGIGTVGISLVVVAITVVVLVALFWRQIVGFFRGSPGTGAPEVQRGFRESVAQWVPKGQREGETPTEKITLLDRLRRFNRPKKGENRTRDKGFMRLFLLRTYERRLKAFEDILERRATFKYPIEEHDFQEATTNARQYEDNVAHTLMKLRGRKVPKEGASKFLDDLFPKNKAERIMKVLSGILFHAETSRLLNRKLEELIDKSEDPVERDELEKAIERLKRREKGDVWNFLKFQAFVLGPAFRERQRSDPPEPSSSAFE